MIYDIISQPAQTRSSKKGNRGRRNLSNMPTAGHPRSSSGQPIDQRVSKSAKAGRVRLGVARKARRA
jgi:hypothetical protein